MWADPRNGEKRMLDQEKIKACNKCHLRAGCTQVVTGIGNLQAKVMIVGEGPGGDEDLLGEPFVGMCGKLLRKMLKQAGFVKGDLYITNAVKCWTYDVNGSRKKCRPPKTDEIQACKSWLWAEVQEVNPEAIITLGATASKLLLNGVVKKSMLFGKIVGKEYTVKYTNARIFPSPHPAYILRQGKEVQEQTQEILNRVRNSIKWQ